MGRAEKRGKESGGETGQMSSIQAHAKGRHMLNNGRDESGRRT